MVSCMLVGATAAAQPGPLDVRVRVLERERLTQATARAAQLSCEGALLPSPQRTRVDGARLVVGEKVCTELTLSGSPELSTDERTFRYPGVLRLTAARGALVVINSVDVEAYVARVLGAELAAGPPAALEAQAVVARTFALAARDRHADHALCDLTHCQRYSGDVEPSQAVQRATEATRGLVLRRGGVALVPTYFHAACGGHTSDEAWVFPGRTAEPTGQAVPDLLRGKPACAAAPDFQWTWSTSRLDLARAVGRKDTGAAFEPLQRDEAGRVVQLRTFGLRLSGADFASLVGRAFGWQALRSLRVSTTEVEGELRFEGRGLGHGVGLCQAGAVARAEAGADRAALLRHYFPGSVVGPVRERP